MINDKIINIFTEYMSITVHTVQSIPIYIYI